VEINAENIKVSAQEIEDAYKQISPKQLNAVKNAAKNIYEYHLRHGLKDQIEGEEGKRTGFLVRPLECAGIYVPGGTAPYPSSVLMCALPAKAAGVKRIVMCSPKIQNPLTLVAANECGVHEIYRVGGAQAVAAMSYGTTCVPKVDIIAGPGNIYVTMAKKEVFGDVKIDMLAGPSEILVIADKDASPALVAADMLSQAEHDKLSRSILVTDNKELAFAVKEELVKQTSLLGRKDIAEYSLKNNGAIIVTKSLRQAVEISDMIAPEHLEIATKNPDELLPFINNAGAVFAGYYTSEPLGDYYAGPSHVLPTGGTAKYFEALNTATFLKRISYIEYDKENIAFAADDIITLAETEGFAAHANAIRKRLGDVK
jgi:histidinol dehydrogenase